MPTGIVISKPAWMLDELGRLEAYDARVILQPEAFSSWGSPVADWSPDVLKQSGWSHTQKYSPFRYSILAELTGNFFDLVFDAQNHVVRKATAKANGPDRYIGQPEDVGWIDVSPWVAGDAPGEVCDRPTLGERRQCLAVFGEKLAPASGDPLENEYGEEWVATTLDLATPVDDGPRPPGALGANVPLDPHHARQRNPRVSAGPDGAGYAVWQDARSGIDQIRIARIAADGTIESRPVLSSGTGQIFPQVAVSAAGAIHVVWQELEPRPRIVRTFASSWNDGFFPLPLPVTLSPPIGVFAAIDEQWKPAIALDAEERLHVAWIGLTDGFERLFYTRIEPDGGGFSETSGPLDAEAFPAPEPLAERLNNRWNPAVAARTLADGATTVAVAWTDFRNYAWDIFAAVSTDGGESFSPHARVDDSLTEHERLHNDPAVQIAVDGTVRVAWSDQGGRRVGCADCSDERRPDTDIVFARRAPGTDAFSANVRVDDTGDGLATGDRVGFSSQWRP
ncbi:MAG: hypothetical protein ACREQY_16620, partial [Candidatus Binatia bacterium]